LAIAAVLLLSLGGPTSAQFFQFWRISAAAPPQRGDGRLGGGWFGNDTSGPFQQRAPQLGGIGGGLDARARGFFKGPAA